MAKLPLDPSMPASEQTYALLSSVAGITLTEADVIVKSITRGETLDEASGLYTDDIVLQYVGTSTILKNTGDSDEVATTFNSVHVDAVLTQLGHTAPLTVYCKATVSSPWGLYSDALEKEILPYLQKYYGLNLSINDVVGKTIDKGGASTFPYPDASIEIDTFGYRGKLRLNLLKEDRVDFATKFKTGVALNGFGAPTKVTTLEADESLIPDVPEPNDDMITEG